MKAKPALFQVDMAMAAQWGQMPTFISRPGTDSLGDHPDRPGNLSNGFWACARTGVEKGGKLLLCKQNQHCFKVKIVMAFQLLGQMSQCISRPGTDSPGDLPDRPENGIRSEQGLESILLFSFSLF